MTIRPYFASSSKVWSSIDWIFGIEECGYEGWEISADGNYRLTDPEALTRIKETVGSTNLRVSVHAPYTDLNMASLNYPIYQETVRQLSGCIESAGELTDRVTIHPGYLSPAAKLVPEKVWDLQKEALRELGRVGLDCGVLVCLENMINIEEFLCRYPDEISGMVGDIEGVGMTFDVGHANTVGVVNDFLNMINNVDHIHVHDNNGHSDEHLALGMGVINWDDVGHRIAEGYSGICVVEGRNIPEAAKSLDTLRRCFV